VDKEGDEMEFFHFTSLSRDSFQELVEICAGTIESLPLKNGASTPKA
jgi:hypothetical protein